MYEAIVYREGELTLMGRISGNSFKEAAEIMLDLELGRFCNKYKVEKVKECADFFLVDVHSRKVKGYKISPK